jgi:hypothetical protein
MKRSCVPSGARRTQSGVKIPLKVARWITLTALLLTLLRMLLFLVLGTFVLMPKGHTWSGYCGHTLAEKRARCGTRYGVISRRTSSIIWINGGHCLLNPSPSSLRMTTNS